MHYEEKQQDPLCYYIIMTPCWRILPAAVDALAMCEAWKLNGYVFFLFFFHLLPHCRRTLMPALHVVWGCSVGASPVLLSSTASVFSAVSGATVNNEAPVCLEECAQIESDNIFSSTARSRPPLVCHCSRLAPRVQSLVSLVNGSKSWLCLSATFHRGLDVAFQAEFDWGRFESKE